MTTLTIGTEPQAMRGGVARPLLLIAAFTAWNYASDVLSDRLQTDTLGWASPWKLPLVALGIAFQCGALVGLGCVVWGRTSLRGLGWTAAEPRRLVGIGLAVTALFIAMIVAVYGIFGGWGGVRELGHAIATLPIGRRVWFTVMGAKVAFVEETLFRGDLLKALTARMGTTAGIVVSSIVFAFFHRTLEPVPLVMKFFMGVMFAVSAAKTGSLVPGALAHWLLWAIVADN
jgi:membrane protease YdiL (CAAX protease family)